MMAPPFIGIGVAIGGAPNVCPGMAGASANS